MFLVDSGGQYFDGTTDITVYSLFLRRVFGRGKTFTFSVKGMINLSKSKFLYGVAGTNLDVLARQALLNIGVRL